LTGDCQFFHEEKAMREDIKTQVVVNSKVKMDLLCRPPPGIAWGGALQH
jgi:hypothetical protein